MVCGENVRCFPETGHDILAIGPCNQKQFVEHAATEADAAVAGAFAADGGDEGGVGDAVCGEGEAEEHAAGVLKEVEGDARLWVGVGGWGLRGCKCGKGSSEEGEGLHDGSSSARRRNLELMFVYNYDAMPKSLIPYALLYRLQSSEHLFHPRAFYSFPTHFICVADCALEDLIYRQSD